MCKFLGESTQIGQRECHANRRGGRLTRSEVSAVPQYPAPLGLDQRPSLHLIVRVGPAEHDPVPVVDAPTNPLDPVT